MFLKNQKKSVTWIDPRKEKPAFNKVVLISFGEDKNVYIGFYTNGGGWRVLNGLYAGITNYDLPVELTQGLCYPLYWAHFPDVPKF